MRLAAYYKCSKHFTDKKLNIKIDKIIRLFLPCYVYFGVWHQLNSQIEYFIIQPVMGQMREQI